MANQQYPKITKTKPGPLNLGFEIWREKNRGRLRTQTRKVEVGEAWKRKRSRTEALGTGVNKASETRMSGGRCRTEGMHVRVLSGGYSFSPSFNGLDSFLKLPMPMTDETDDDGHSHE
jgi:hypothetical protein